MIDPATADAIYDILVEYCGARDTPDQRWDFNFAVFVDDRVEYRFIGDLGFGGKFYCERNQWRVGCYREDNTPERKSMIDKANWRLEKIRNR